MVTNLTIWLPNGLKKITFILTRRGESRPELKKIIWMVVCRNLENLENIGSNRKSVLRARRTRTPKIAKFHFFQNSNRYDQNVGKVPISRKMALKKSKCPFWAKISLIFFFFDFWTQGGPPIGPLFGRRASFFADTGMSKPSCIWGVSKMPCYGFNLATQSCASNGRSGSSAVSCVSWVVASI